VTSLDFEFPNWKSTRRAHNSTRFCLSFNSRQWRTLSWWYKGMYTARSCRENCTLLKDTVGRRYRGDSDQFWSRTRGRYNRDDTKRFVDERMLEQGRRPGSDEAQNRIKVISDKSEHPPRTCSENSFSPRSGCDESNGKLEEQRRTMTVTRRRRNNRAEAEGDEVFELWTEVPSSFLHPLHSDSRSKKERRSKRRRSGRKVHLQYRVSRKSFGLSVANCSQLETVEGIRMKTSSSSSEWIEVRRVNKMFDLPDHYRIRNTEHAD